MSICTRSAPPLEPTERDSGGDGHACGGGQKRLPDAAGKRGRIGLPPTCFQRLKGLDHAKNRAKQSNQWCDSCDQFKRAQSTTQNRKLMCRKARHLFAGQLVGEFARIERARDEQAFRRSRLP